MIQLFKCNLYISICTYVGVLWRGCTDIHHMPFVCWTGTWEFAEEEGHCWITACCGCSGTWSSVRKLPKDVCKEIYAACIVSCWLCTIFFPKSVRDRKTSRVKCLGIISANVMVYKECSTGIEWVQIVHWVIDGLLSQIGIFDVSYGFGLVLALVLELIPKWAKVKSKITVSFALVQFW